MERAVGGDLEGTLRTMRDDGLSFEQIAARLYVEHDIEVTGATIRNWWVAYTEPAEAAS